jgi:uncharacterized membrane protein
MKSLLRRIGACNREALVEAMGRAIAYFAFTVGTSFAVSDVDVSADAVRQAVLGHQILSFFYNTSILATVGLSRRAR